MIGSIIGVVSAAAKNVATNAANNKKKTTNTGTSTKTNTNTGYTNPSAYQGLLNGGNEHANYINNTYAGGMDAYTKLQNNRYASALKNNDVNLLNKLNADAQRVGYSFNTPKQETPTMPELNLPKYEAFDYKDFNYKDFEYDFNNDELYKAYADKYAREGQSASERALANASAATGGMPSSYAAAANAQAQQAYAKKTADMIPVLEGQAYDRYSNERNFSYQDYLNNRNLGYNEHQNEYNAGLNNAQALYNDAWQRLNYADSRNDLAYDREKAQEAFDYEKFLNEQNRNDTLAQRDIDNTYRQNAFDWNRETDTRNYDRDVLESDRSYNYNAGQDAIRNSISWANNSLSERKFEYDKQQDELTKEKQMQDNVNAMLDKQKETLRNATAQKMETERQNDIYAALSSALSAKNINTWLDENFVALKQAGIYEDVYKDLTDRVKFNNGSD